MSDVPLRPTIDSRLEQALKSPRIAIESTQPVLDDGRFAAKAIVGQPITVSTRIFADGHDVLAAAVCWRLKGEQNWRRAPLKRIDPGLDLWQGRFTATQVASHEFCIEAWW